MGALTSCECDSHYESESSRGVRLSEYVVSRLLSIIA